nr:glycosyltransferase family 2 protein [Actinomycetota bacterium]
MPDFISVVVPTFRRPTSLRRCLVALDTQSRLPDEVVVAVRDSDSETSRLVATWSSRFRLDTVRVERPGGVAALNAALAVVQGDVVAFIDDDTEPHADWLARVAAHFEQDPTLGGLGGRDCNT